MFCLLWIAVCLTLFTWYWAFVNVISYLQKILTSMEVVNVCVCVCLPEVTWRFHPIWWSSLTFFPLAFGDGCEYRSWLTDACQKPPFSFSKTTYDGLRSLSPAEHRDHASCNWSGMESAISQLPVFPQGSHHIIHIIHIYSTIFLSVSPVTCQGSAESAKGKRHPLNLARKPQLKTSLRYLKTKLKQQQKNRRTNLIYNLVWMFKKYIFQNLFSVDIVIS